ncbi:MAG: ribonucleoside-diphosphate reductase subunit alpha [Lachnospiraceae bacterium]
MELSIKKRNSETVIFSDEKIIQAMSKAYQSVSLAPDQVLIHSVTEQIRSRAAAMAEHGDTITVEEVQDLVEKSLMEHEVLNVAKSYILYRDHHASLRKKLDLFQQAGFPPAILQILSRIQDTFTEDYDLGLLYHKTVSFLSVDMTYPQRLDAMIRSSLELTSQDSPMWEFISARLLYQKIKEEIQLQNEQHSILSFADKVEVYTKENLYGEELLTHYTREELNEAAAFIKEEHNELLNYSSLNLLHKRYLLRTFDNKAVETPQEMFLGIALHLAIPETTNRLPFVRDLYEILSQLQVTMATPTLSNARKPHHQLSSCFIDTVDDSLNGIYKSIDNFAKVSKSGGGMGLYFGKVRANGSDIRGFKGVAGGVIRWIKLANDTAVAVDQLGVRQGSVAVYLDVWHKDLPEFLQMKTNNGDDRYKAHDVFPAVCYPDLFWKLAKTGLDNTWYLMCPHEIKAAKGYCLEDYYGAEWEKRYYSCVEDPAISKREILLRDLVRMIIKSCVETGTPFTFNRDTVNETNPNKHCGIIYSSNLCTEILQNMSPIQQLETEIIEVNGETVVVEKNVAGDFVVCNLASLVLGHINTEDDAELKKIIRTVVRALDNVIDLNAYPLPYAQITNKKYRPIGLGISGYHHMLVKKGIRWESEEHLAYADELFEKINYAAIEASMLLAEEKGRYQKFKGSEWQNGNYFSSRGYTSDSWLELAASVEENGLRNAYLLAIAPTGSTSIISATTAGIDPVMHKYFLEEKKGDIVPRVAPDLNPETYWLYKSAHNIDQTWSVRANAIRQRHIDQSQSFNLYITTDYSMRQIMDLYLLAWEEGVKTIYYIRSKSLEVDICESCSS